MRCLVVGSTGFIGRHLAAALVSAGHQTQTYDRRMADPLPGVKARRGELSDSAELGRALTGIEVVFHLAWTGYPGTALSMPASVRANLLGSVDLMTACSQAEVKRFVFASSGGAVYGTSQRLPIDETHPTRPLAVYGLHKLLVEQHLDLLAKRGTLTSLVLRPGNAYGPGQHPGRGQGLIAAAMGRLARDLPLEIWGSDQVVRDYVYIDDVVRAFAAAAEAPLPSETVFNIGSGKGHSIREVLDGVMLLSGRKLTERTTAATTGSVDANILDCHRAKEQLGWTPQVSLHAGLAATWRWIKDTWLPSLDE